MRLRYYYLVKDRVVVCIPKVAYTSLQDWFVLQWGELRRKRNCTAAFVGLPKGWPIHAVIRNPYDRLASAFQNKFVDEGYRPELKIGTFDDFIGRLADVDLEAEDHHWRPQSWFVTPDVKLIPLARIEEYFPGIKHLNQTCDKPRWTQKTQSLVEELYAKDFELCDSIGIPCSANSQDWKTTLWSRLTHGKT